MFYGVKIFIHIDSLSTFWILEQAALLTLPPPRWPATVWPDPNLGGSRTKTKIARFHTGENTVNEDLTRYIILLVFKYIRCLQIPETKPYLTRIIAPLSNLSGLRLELSHAFLPN